MREIRPSGSEGGAAQSNALSLPLSWDKARAKSRRRNFRRLMSASLNRFDFHLLAIPLSGRSRDV
jgi:hypothetical protein